MESMKSNGYKFVCLIQAFAKCFLTKIGFLDGAGNFVPSVAEEKLGSYIGDNAKAAAAINECKAADAGDKDAIPLAIYKCYTQHKLLKHESNA